MYCANSLPDGQIKISEGRANNKTVGPGTAFASDDENGDFHRSATACGVLRRRRLRQILLLYEKEGHRPAVTISGRYAHRKYPSLPGRGDPTFLRRGRRLHQTL